MHSAHLPRPLGAVPPRAFFAAKRTFCRAEVLSARSRVTRWPPSPSAASDHHLTDGGDRVGGRDAPHRLPRREAEHALGRDDRRVQPRRRACGDGPVDQGGGTHFVEEGLVDRG
eukprot:379955-Prymnesium_polylepis.1